MLQPGKPQAKLQAVCTAEWERKRLIVNSPTPPTAAASRTD